MAAARRESAHGIVALDEGAHHHRDRLRWLLREHAYEARPVVLASGRTSDFYVDCRKVVLTAEGHFLVGWLLNHVIRRICPRALAVGGMSLGADPLVSATALISHLGGGQPLDGFYVRKEPKRHGTGQRIEGANRLPAGAPVVIVEDVVTSGGSTLQAVEQARQAGLDPLLALALLDREEGGRAAIEQHLPLHAIFTAKELRQ